MECTVEAGLVRVGGVVCWMMWMFLCQWNGVEEGR